MIRSLEELKQFSSQSIVMYKSETLIKSDIYQCILARIIYDTYGDLGFTIPSAGSSKFRAGHVNQIRNTTVAFAFS